MSTSSVSSTGQKACIDLTPYAMNPELLSILQNTTGNVPNDAAVYFKIPATFASGEYTYCLENIAIPESVGGKSCSSDSGPTNCWLAVGYRHETSPSTIIQKKREEEGDTSAFECVCNGSTMNNYTFSETSVADACGLEANDRWGLTCRSSNHQRLNGELDGTTVYSSVANAYISVCPELHNYCGICAKDGTGVIPSFVVGVQWVSNLQEQCIQDPFASYEQHCSNPRFSTTSIVAMIVGGAVLSIVGLALFYVCRKGKTKKSPQLANPVVAETDVEKQHMPRTTSPPIPVISITSDGSSSN